MIPDMDLAPADLDRRLPGPWFEVGGLPLPVAVAFARRADGQLACTGLVIGWDGSQQPITARTLSALHLPALLEGFAALPGVAALVDAAPPAAERGLPAAHYTHVAEQYALARAERPRAPVQRLCERLDTSPASAHRWLAVCRSRGLLDRTGRRGPRL